MTVDDDMYGTEKSFGRASQGSDYYGESSRYHDGIGRRVIESFKRDPNFAMTPKGSMGADGKVYDVEGAAANTANSPLARRLKGRHLQMIAIGGSIGMPRARAVQVPIPCADISRNRAFCRLRPGPGQRRSSLARYRLLSRRHHAVLHSACARRNGGAVSCRRFLFGLLYALSGSCVGLRHGLELCTAMAGRASPRDRRRHLHH